jgi:hypothetical protein
VKNAAFWITLLGLCGCNALPPLDCVLGASRAGCERDANGNYGYLYGGNGGSNPPVVVVPAYTPPHQVPFYAIPAQQPARLQTTCTTIGNITSCN